jgi:di/tricarboxylate transporter
VALIPLIVGLVELVKQLGLPSRYAALVAVALGVGAGFLLTPSDPAQAVVVGIMLGLSASGLYSGTKAALGK